LKLSEPFFAENRFVIFTFPLKGISKIAIFSKHITQKGAYSFFRLSSASELGMQLVASIGSLKLLVGGR